MSARHLILALLPAVLLGIVCSHLYGELQRERERARTESALRSDLQTRVVQLDGRRAQLERELTRLRVGLQQPVALEAPRSVSPPPASAPAAGAAASSVETPFVQPGAAQLEWMRSPIARDLMRAHQRDWIRRSSGELFGLLDLSDEQAAQLVVLMAEAQTPPVELGPGTTDPGAFQNRMREQQRAGEAAIKELLGEEKYRTFREYQGSATERMQLAELQRLFEATPAPLDADQSAQLLAILAEERTRGPYAMRDTRILTDEDAQRLQQSYQEHELRVRERVAAVLTPEQLERFLAYQRMQDAMRQDTMGPNGVVAQGGVMFSAFGVQSSE
jgi:hypothetical protein